MRYLFDENFSHRIPRAFSALGIDAKHVNDIGLHSADDPEVIHYAKSKKRTFITLDKHIRTREHERAAFTDAEIGVVQIRFSKKHNLWTQFKFLVNKWEKIQENISASVPPFWIVVSSGGRVKRL